QSGERSRSRPERDAVEAAQVERVMLQQRIHHAEQQLRMPLPGEHIARVDLSAAGEGNRAMLGGRVERQDLHRMNSIREGVRAGGRKMEARRSPDLPIS